MRPAIAAMSGRLVFIFLLPKGLRGKAFTKEASLYLVVSTGLLAILVTARRQLSWLDVSVSTAEMLSVVLGSTSDNICAIKLHLERFKKLVLIAVIAARAELLRHGFLQLTGLPCRCGWFVRCRRSVGKPQRRLGGEQAIDFTPDEQASQPPDIALAYYTRHLLHCTEAS